MRLVRILGRLVLLLGLLTFSALPLCAQTKPTAQLTAIRKALTALGYAEIEEDEDKGAWSLSTPGRLTLPGPVARVSIVLKSTEEDAKASFLKQESEARSELLRDATFLGVLPVADGGFATKSKFTAYSRTTVGTTQVVVSGGGALFRCANLLVYVSWTKALPISGGANHELISAGLASESVVPVKSLAEKTANALHAAGACSGSKSPTIKLDRLEGTPASPLRLIGSSGFKLTLGQGEAVVNEIRILWDGDTLELGGRADKDGVLFKLSRLDPITDPWIWVFIPRNAVPGKHTLQAVQDSTGLKSNVLTINVLSQPTKEELAKSFDAILERYESTVPANPNSSSGPRWNLRNAFSSDPAFKCGDYQSHTLRLLLKLLFSTNVDDRKLMDGFDFGPLKAGYDTLRFNHHWVVIWPRDSEWKSSGIYLDPWLNQRPRAFVRNPDDPTGWWKTCIRYNKDYPYSWRFPSIPAGLDFFVDRTSSDPIEWQIGATADTLVYNLEASGFSFPTHSKNFNYRDLIHIGVNRVKNASPGPPPPMQTVVAHCPIRVLITDGTGKRIGTLDGKSVYNEIPAAYWQMDPSPQDNASWIFGLPEGTYKVQISAFGDGQCQLLTERQGVKSMIGFPTFSVNRGDTGEFSIGASGAISDLVTSRGVRHASGPVTETKNGKVVPPVKLPDLSGTWYFRGDERFTCRIAQSASNQLDVTTEKGQRGSGRLIASDSVIVDFPFAKGLKGAVSADAGTISWANGEKWMRKPSSAPRGVGGDYGSDDISGTWRNTATGTDSLLINPGGRKGRYQFANEAPTPDKQGSWKMVKPKVYELRSDSGSLTITFTLSADGKLRGPQDNPVLVRKKP